MVISSFSAISASVACRPKRPSSPDRTAPHSRRSDAAKQADVALKIETMIAEPLLRSARAARLGDDGLGETGGNIREMVDH
jgi:hypothetical protein